VDEDEALQVEALQRHQHVVDGDECRHHREAATGNRAVFDALADPARKVAVYYVLMTLQGFDLQGLILIHTSCMAAIYAFGMFAAVRLLSRWSLGWWMALVSSVLTVGLLVLAGVHLVIPAVLAVAAIIV
ncbi:hypothetical protein ACC691_36715, partial [Rhizobium johnstonii]